MDRARRRRTPGPPGGGSRATGRQRAAARSRLGDQGDDHRPRSRRAVGTARRTGLGPAPDSRHGAVRRTDDPGSKSTVIGNEQPDVARTFLARRAVHGACRRSAPQRSGHWPPPRRRRRAEHQQRCCHQDAWDTDTAMSFLRRASDPFPHRSSDWTRPASRRRGSTSRVRGERAQLTHLCLRAARRCAVAEPSARRTAPFPCETAAQSSAPLAIPSPWEERSLRVTRAAPRASKRKRGRRGVCRVRRFERLRVGPYAAWESALA